MFTIHQPSSSLFDQFDRVIIMRYGKILFQGFNGKTGHAMQKLLADSVQRSQGQGSAQGKKDNSGGPNGENLALRNFFRKADTTLLPQMDYEGWAENFEKVSAEARKQFPARGLCLGELICLEPFLKLAANRPVPEGFNPADWVLLLAAVMDEDEVTEIRQQTARVYELFFPRYCRR